MQNKGSNLFLSGFTFVRNAMKFDYPVVESITSILPIVDEMIVLLGNSDDETEALIQSIDSPKIKIFHSVWDDSLREGGRVLADQTNKAMQHISPNADWAFYMQADEVLHEKYHVNILQKLKENTGNAEIEGFLFDYVHFYGDYNFVADSRKWYRNEIRIIRPHIGVNSWKDAQGFRIGERKLHVKKIGAAIYHYGWVKPPELQQAKQAYFHQLWHTDAWMKENIPQTAQFDYSKIDSVKRFEGTHPVVMLEKVQHQFWKVEIDPNKKRLSFKTKLLAVIEKLTGWRVGEYKNYRLLK
jgi:glycosyltransferase involved in cell wall biosynthesis